LKGLDSEWEGARFGRMDWIGDALVFYHDMAYNMGPVYLPFSFKIG
jgi:hypothetical protein